MENSSRFFANKECKYFPCHKTGEADDFNCMFCYCPLYALGNDCGGNPAVSASGKKSCINCDFPHRPENYDLLMERLKKLSDVL